MERRMTTDLIYVKSMKPHYHEGDLEIVLVLEGEVTVHKMERLVHLKEGEFTFINRRIVHYITSEGAYILSSRLQLNQFRECFKQIEYVEFMTMNEQDLYERPLQERQKAIVRDQVIKDYLLQNRLDGSEPPVLEEKIFNEKQLMHYLFLSFQLMASYKKEDGHQNWELTERYYQIVEYISKHIHEKITTEDVLKEFYMNAAYFSQFMKKVGGIGFKDFVTYRKMVFINMLLLNEQYTINEIAELVEITDMKMFYQNFKKTFKTSPAKWREQILAIEDSYEIQTDVKLVERFVVRHRIDHHRENSMSRYYRFISCCKEKGISLQDTEVMVNPYEDMGDEIDRDYQAYKYSGALFELIREVGAKVVLAYPMKIVLDEEVYALTVTTLKHIFHMNEVNEVKKWRILLKASNVKELETAQRLKKEIEEKIGSFNVDIVLELK